jgi:hypothetical protein
MSERHSTEARVITPLRHPSLGLAATRSMRIPLTALLCSSALLAPLDAQAPAHRAARPLPPAGRVPTLIVFITVDQMRADYFARYGKQLTGGLGRLARGGAYFTNAMLDYESTETAPGHATGMSGRFPEHTGIASNSRGVFDPQAPVIGSTQMFASPFRFRGGTLTDWLRMKDPRTRAISVSRKDRGAILPLGRAHQEAYWYDPNSGNFSTSTYYSDTLPSWLIAYNARRVPATYAGYVWKPLLPDSAYPEPDSVVFENFGNDFMFPHALPADTALAIRSLPEMPVMDDVTLQVALTGLKQTNLGTGTWTDVLAISLSTTDQIGHRYGPDSKEMHDQIVRLDRALGVFLDSLFTMRDPARVVITLTADHGIAPIPEAYTVATHHVAQRVNLSGAARRVQLGLIARGADSADFNFEDAMLFVDRAKLERAGINVDSVVKSFAVEVRTMPGVARVDRLAALMKDTLTDPVARRWIHTVPADFPVELVVTLKPYSVWGTYAPGIHGSPYDYDNNVPVLFYGAPFTPGRYTMSARVVDMAPTLAWVTGTVPADRVDGSILWNVLAK